MKNKKAQDNSGGLGTLIKVLLLIGLFALLFFGVKWLITFLTSR